MQKYNFNNAENKYSSQDRESTEDLLLRMLSLLSIQHVCIYNICHYRNTRRGSKGNKLDRDTTAANVKIANIRRLHKLGRPDMHFW